MTGNKMCKAARRTGYAAIRAGPKHEGLIGESAKLTKIDPNYEITAFGRDFRHNSVGSAFVQINP